MSLMSFPTRAVPSLVQSDILNCPVIIIETSVLFESNCRFQTTVSVQQEALPWPPGLTEQRRVAGQMSFFGCCRWCWNGRRLPCKRCLRKIDRPALVAGSSSL